MKNNRESFSAALVVLFLGCSPFMLGEIVPNNFDKEKDLFIAQFDSIPDSDDIHSQAAVGCLLAHPDFTGVNYFAVAGAYGVQVRNQKFKFIDDKPAARAAARWVDAHGEISRESDDKGRPKRSPERIAKLKFAAEVIVERVKPVLAGGGRVFVMDAGQSDFTVDWVKKLIEAGVKNTATHVILVQHSQWNERHTSGNKWFFADGENDWEFINDSKNLNYVRIDDGNRAYGSEDRDRGIYDTPGYLNADSRFLDEATDQKNPNAKARKLWTLAKRIADESSYEGKVIRAGGVDFSDTVEAMWIFDLSQKEDGYTTVEDFWKEFVTKGWASEVSLFAGF